MAWWNRTSHHPCRAHLNLQWEEKNKLLSYLGCIFWISLLQQFNLHPNYYRNYYVQVESSYLKILKCVVGLATTHRVMGSSSTDISD